MSTATTHLVTLANTNDGSVHGHKAGCADLRRGKAYKNHRDEQFEVEVATKREAFLDYNSDFIAEGGEENAWPVEWLPCADHVPAGDAEPVEAAPAPEPKKATKADQIAILLERGGYARPALQKMTLAALTALVAEAPAAATARPLPAADEEGWLGQIREGDQWLDYARSLEAEAREWQKGDPVNRRLVHWIDKSVLVDATAAVSQPAKTKAPKAKRTKNATVEIDGYTVKTGAWCTVHDSEGKRIALIRRDAVPALSQAVAEKVLRVQTEFRLGTGPDGKSIGWIRNGESLAKVAKVLKKALAAGGTK